MSVDVTSRRQRSWATAWRGSFRGRRGLPIVPAVVIALTFIAVVVAEVAVGRFLPSETALDLANYHLPPVPLPDSSFSHILGTDRLGRDVLSRLLVGAKFSLAVGLLTVGFAALVGSAAGIAAGYVGGWVDRLVMRTADIMLSFPGILVALAFVVTVGPSLLMLVVVLSLNIGPQFARLVRADVIVWRNRPFVLMAQLCGASPPRIIIKHILPNVMNGIVVLATLQIGWVMIAEAGLSFLGAGIPPPAPSWGNMLADGRDAMTTAWWLTVVPGLAISLVVLSFNLLGDWLRDTLDPHLRQIA